MIATLFPLSRRPYRGVRAPSIMPTWAEDDENSFPLPGRLEMLVFHACSVDETFGRLVAILIVLAAVIMTSADQFLQIRFVVDGFADHLTAFAIWSVLSGSRVALHFPLARTGCVGCHGNAAATVCHVAGINASVPGLGRSVHLYLGPLLNLQSISNFCPYGEPR